MYDILTTAAILDELNEVLTGGRVQRVGLRDRNTVVLEVYARRTRHYLIASIGGREPVCYLTHSAVGIDSSVVTPLSLLLRKYVRGGTLTAVDQPPLDRIIRLSISKTTGPPRQSSSLAGTGLHELVDDPDSDSDDDWNVDREVMFSSLNIELMGRRSNIILVDNDGIILESIKRVTASMSRVRPILPRGDYALPPAGDRRDPRAMTEAEVGDLLKDADPALPLANLLVSKVAAMSPQIAAEIVFRSTGSSKTRCGELVDDSRRQVAAQTQELFGLLDGSSWKPVVYVDQDGEFRAYAANAQAHLEQLFTPLPVASMSEAVETASNRDLAVGRHAARRDRLAASVAGAQERARSKVATLELQRRDLLDGDRYRRWGEAIYANLWTIAPGQSELETGGEVIPMKTEVPPKELAQQYFSRYRKSGRGLDQIDGLIRQAANELAYIDQLATLVAVAETFEEIEALRHEWEGLASPTGDAPESVRKRKPPKKAMVPRPIIDQYGNAVYVGRSGPANDVVTFDVAGPEDYWLHARGVPGAHVILRPARPSTDRLERGLEDAAALAAYFSASRNDSSVSVDICKRRDVRKLKGAGPGMVTYRNERTIRVKPNSNG